MDKLNSLISKRHAAPKQSRLLALPPELRTLLYENVFANIENEVQLPLAKQTSIRKRIKQKLTPRGKRSSCLCLLLTCKQIRSETLNYVHGVCPAVLNSQDTHRWALTHVLTGRMPKQMARAVDIGGPSLKHVTHLKLRGTYAATFLLGADDGLLPGAAGLSSLKFEDRLVVRQCIAALKVSAAMPNVRTVTLVIDCERYLEYIWKIEMVAKQGWIETTISELELITIKCGCCGNSKQGKLTDVDGSREWIWKRCDNDAASAA